MRRNRGRGSESDTQEKKRGGGGGERKGMEKEEGAQLCRCIVQRGERLLGDK